MYLYPYPTYLLRLKVFYFFGIELALISQISRRRAALKKFIDASKSDMPVAFLNLICQKEETTPSASKHGATAKTVLKTDRDKFTCEICTEDPKAVRLKTNVDKLRATNHAQITVVSELSILVPCVIGDY